MKAWRKVRACSPPLSIATQVGSSPSILPGNFTAGIPTVLDTAGAIQYQGEILITVSMTAGCLDSLCTLVFLFTQHECTLVFLFTQQECTLVFLFTQQECTLAFLFTQQECTLVFLFTQQECTLVFLFTQQECTLAFLFTQQECTLVFS